MLAPAPELSVPTNNSLIRGHSAYVGTSGAGDVLADRGEVYDRTPGGDLGLEAEASLTGTVMVMRVMACTGPGVMVGIPVDVATGERLDRSVVDPEGREPGERSWAGQAGALTSGGEVVVISSAGLCR
jgi:hypothetical protein